MWFCGDCVDARGVAGPSPHTASFPLVVSGNPSFLYAVIPAVSGRYLFKELFLPTTSRNDGHRPFLVIPAGP